MVFCPFDRKNSAKEFNNFWTPIGDQDQHRSDLNHTATTTVLRVTHRFTHFVSPRSEVRVRGRDAQEELAQLREWLSAPSSGAKDEHRQIAGLRGSASARTAYTVPPPDRRQSNGPN